MPDVKFIHPAGDVLLRNVDVSIRDAVATITGLVTPDVWDHIEMEDAFGARTRTRHGILVGDGDVRLTVRGSESAMSVGPSPHAHDWVIVDAQRRLADTPVEGEAWIGTTFSESTLWSLATNALSETGFVLSESGSRGATFADAAGRIVIIDVDSTDQIATVSVRVDLDTTISSAPTEALVVLNALNSRFSVGTVSIVGGTVVVKSGLPLPDGSDLGPVLEALAYGLPGLANMVVEVLRPVFAGTKTASDALSQVFG